MRHGDNTQLAIFINSGKKQKNQRNTQKNSNTKAKAKPLKRRKKLDG